MKTLKEKLQAWVDEKPPANIILLTSVENQEAADTRIPELLKIPARCHGLSCEPLLDAVDLGLVENGAESPEEKSWAKPTRCGCLLDWVIVGGESGPGARPCNIAWIRSIVEQGKVAGVATFVKQFSGKKSGEQGELPDELFRIREYPEGF